MLICPKCRTTYSSSLARACYRDGEKLVDHDAFTAAERDPLRGRVIDDKYRVLERIGVGGMGTVYKAAQAGLLRHVAVKILKPELTRDPDTVARFSREATAMSLLTHANTTRVYDFGQTEDGLLYLVMEFLQGELLTQYQTRTGPVAPLTAVRIAQQILRSLAEAHTKGVVHRDLKPDNIFLATVEGHEEAVVKVLDFGIAKIVAPDKPVDQFETQAGTVFGTPRYMSPEQAQGAQLDQRSDLYSVGAMLYQLLTGRAPFTDDDAVVVMAKHIRELPTAPRSVVPEQAIPETLDQVVMRALAKAPSERFQSAAAFDAALEACVPEVAQAPLVRPPSAKHPFRRNYLAWTLTAGSLIAASYVGLRVLAKNAEPRTIVADLRPAEPAEPTSAPANDRPANADANDRPMSANANDLAAPEATPALEDDDLVLPEGPEPAVVALRSDPMGATVLRDGEPLGATPMSLIVRPNEEFVRIELRMDGYQPLAAELTAKDGERVLKLDRTAPKAGRRPAGTRHGSAKRNDAVGAPTPNPGDPVHVEPSEPRTDPQGPYERFE